MARLGVVMLHILVALRSGGKLDTQVAVQANAAAMLRVGKATKTRINFTHLFSRQRQHVGKGVHESHSATGHREQRVTWKGSVAGIRFG